MRPASSRETGDHIVMTEVHDKPVDTDSSSTDVDQSDEKEGDVDDDVEAFLGQNQPSSYENRAMFSNIDTTTLPEPQSYAEARRAPDAQQWMDAMERERQSLIDTNAYKIVKPPPGCKVITGRWVYKRKIGYDGKVKTYKARLVARGFQQTEGIDFQETYAGVVKSLAYRVIFAISSILGWRRIHMDVKTAFLNSRLKDAVYMKPPPTIKTPKGMVLLVLSALYGLKQSPREWYEKFWKTLENWGWRRSPYDYCIFIHDEFRLIIALWVDDLIITGPCDETIDEFRQQVSSTFKMVDEGECSFYLGTNIERDNEGTSIHQEKYIKQILNKYGLANIVPASTPADPRVTLAKECEETASQEFLHEYRSKVGSLNWPANVCRPDIAHSTSVAGRFNANPNQQHMDAVNRIYAYLKGTVRRGLHYKKGAAFDLHGFVDADYAGCPDTRRSTTGWVFLIGGSPVSWCSQRQRTVSYATTDAEYIAAAEAAKEAVWLKGFINDLRIPKIHVECVPLYIDNNAALRLTKNPEYHARTKHIDVKYHLIREKVEEGQIDTRRVDTDCNVADIFTKALGGKKFGGFVKTMGLDHNQSGTAEDEE